MNAIPKFAFVGPVNQGKTSAIATLLEEDGLRISKVPGETTECQGFDLKGPDGKPIIAFYDTPGFQNPRSTLLKLRELKQGQGEPLEVFRRFVAKFGGTDDFAEECKLFAPILDGAGIIYVVDASQRVLPINEDEMEILRMTGQPLLGLINWTAEPVYKQDWKNTLHLYFRAWEFNAHKASYFERIALLKTLIGLEQAWAPALERAVAVLGEDWKQRTRDCAGVISEMLIQSLECTETGRGEDEAARERLVQKYQDGIRAIERSAHEKIVGIFNHHKVSIGRANFEFEQDLFSTKTWEVLGLSPAQLTWAGAAAGAAGGLAVEAGLLGHGLGIPTILGTLVGAGGAATGAFLGGERLTKVKTPLPLALRRFLGRETLGGTAMTIGPNAARNFPWILVDRALIVCHFVIHRAHARQEKVILDPEELRNSSEVRQGLSAQWNKDSRNACEKVFQTVRANKATPEDRERLNRALETQLESIVKPT